MSKLLLPTSSLVLRLDGHFDLPDHKHSKTVTIKKLISILKQGPATVMYLGYDFEKPFPENDSIEDCLMVTIHVIEGPLTINFEDPAQTIQHFVKQIRKNSSRILLQSQRSEMGKLERCFEFYVRGSQVQTRSTRRLLQA